MTQRILRVAGAVSALAIATAAHAADPELVVFDWAGFEVQGLIEGYVEKHGQMPTYAFFGDEDEAFQKLTSGFRADVAHPCSQMVGKYRDAGLIEPWDTTRIPEFGNIAPRFLDAPTIMDETGVWFIPTDYAFTALAYNHEQVTAEEASTLQIFVDPKFAGRVSLPDNSDDTWSLALLATGVSNWSAVTDEQFDAAAAWLRLAHANVRAYWSDPSELAQLMKTGEVLVSFTWNDGVAAMRREGVPVTFNRTPEGGAATWFCGLVNLKDGPGSEDKAYDFVNAWLEPRSARALLENFGYAHANDAAMAGFTLEELKAADLDPIEGTLLSQTPLDKEMRQRMLREFELIKTGF